MNKTDYTRCAGGCPKMLPLFLSEIVYKLVWLAVIAWPL